MQRAQIVLVVSLPKSGTHLVGELVKAFGYKVYGPSGPGGFGEPLPPDLFDKLATDLGAVPPNTCIVLHRLRLEEVSDQLASLWQQTGVPAVVFHYRDPRDIYCSWVRFLTGKTHSGGFDPTAPQLIWSEILKSIEDPGERLMHLLRDPSFPGHRDLEEATWLLHHPRVFKTSFEHLVGQAGGGSDELQVRQIAGLMRHLNIMGDPREYARKIFRRDTPTFSRGQIGSWRDELTPEHVRAFQERFGHLLEIYGYE